MNVATCGYVHVATISVHLHVAACGVHVLSVHVYVHYSTYDGLICKSVEDSVVPSSG